MKTGNVFLFIYFFYYVFLINMKRLIFTCSTLSYYYNCFLLSSRIEEMQHFLRSRVRIISIQLNNNIRHHIRYSSDSFTYPYIYFLSFRTILSHYPRNIYNGQQVRVKFPLYSVQHSIRTILTLYCQ